MKMLQQSIANSLETNEKIENLSKEIQIIKIPMEMVELKFQ